MTLEDILIKAYNDIEDVLSALREAGLNENRSVIEHLRDALGSLDDMIVEETTESEQ